MAMPAATQRPKRWTVEEVRAMQDASRPAPRYELIDGELLVTPSPGWPHQAVVGKLYIALDAWCTQTRIGKAMMSPADLELEAGTVTQPDVFVVPRREDGTMPREWRQVGSLLLAVEVLSPSSVRQDRGIKRRFFTRIGVPEYWVVDVEARLVERWRPGEERPEIAAESLAWAPPGAAEPLAVDLPALFTEALGEP